MHVICRPILPWCISRAKKHLTSLVFWSDQDATSIRRFGWASMWIEGTMQLLCPKEAININKQTLHLEKSQLMSGCLLCSLQAPANHPSPCDANSETGVSFGTILQSLQCLFNILQIATKMESNLGQNLVLQHISDRSWLQSVISKIFVRAWYRPRTWKPNNVSNDKKSMRACQVISPVASTLGVDCISTVCICSVSWFDMICYPKRSSLDRPVGSSKIPLPAIKPRQRHRKFGREGIREQSETKWNKCISIFEHCRNSTSLICELELCIDCSNCSIEPLHCQRWSGRSCV